MTRSMTRRQQTRPRKRPPPNRQLNSNWIPISFTGENTAQDNR
jgi:hypothetical protein